MATPYFPIRLRESGGTYKLAEYTNDECVDIGAIPTEAINIIDLPTTRDVTFVPGMRLRQTLADGTTMVTGLFTDVTRSPITVTAGSTMTDSSFNERFTLVQNLPGGAGGGAVSSVSGGVGLNTTGGTTTGAVELNIDRDIRKITLFLGVTDSATTDLPVTLNSIATTYTTYFHGLETWYFINGIDIDPTDDTIRVGQGVWANVDPEFDTLTSSNAFNLIG